ncbi:peptidyl-prolyl cis-trans isomerase CYP23 [Citrus sinensis]|nr:peptidyl-prolyl cis-trans isomerase CYP23 [Citrus sinensis]
MSVNCEPGRKSEQRMGGLPERAFEYYYARVGTRQKDSSSTSCNEEVDKGFVAQVADVVGGRSAPMNEVQRVEAEKTVIGEFSDVKHVRGILSMGRYSDPNSAASSFSILLGDAPHLDGQYAVFGKVTKGDETLRTLEGLPTRKEGIFVMPTERITIHSSYYYDTEMEICEKESHSKLKPEGLSSDFCFTFVECGLIDLSPIQNNHFPSEKQLH